MKHLIITLTALSLLIIGFPAKAEEMISRYSDLQSTSCKVIRQSEFQTIKRCPGLKGFQLQIEAEDIRESLTIIDPSGKSYPLTFWQTVSGAPSTLGSKAEWLFTQTPPKKKIPQALIVRLTTQPHGSPKQSWLVVTRLSPDICITDRIPSGSQANLLARQAASQIHNKRCIPTLPTPP